MGEGFNIKMSSLNQRQEETGESDGESELYYRPQRKNRRADEDSSNIAVQWYGNNRDDYHHAPYSNSNGEPSSIYNRQQIQPKWQSQGREQQYDQVLQRPRAPDCRGDYDRNKIADDGYDRRENYYRQHDLNKDNSSSTDTNAQELPQHLNEGAGVTPKIVYPYPCPVCPWAGNRHKFEKLAGLQKHMKKKHPTHPSLICYLPGCGKDFPSNKLLFKHVHQHDLDRAKEMASSIILHPTSASSQPLLEKCSGPLDPKKRTDGDSSNVAEQWYGNNREDFYHKSCSNSSSFVDPMQILPQQKNQGEEQQCERQRPTAQRSLDDENDLNKSISNNADSRGKEDNKEEVEQQQQQNEPNLTLSSYPYSCPVTPLTCLNKFNRLVKLQRHIKFRHPTHEPNPNRFCYLPGCGTDFPTKQLLFKHVHQHDVERDQEMPSSSSSASQQLKNCPPADKELCSTSSEDLQPILKSGFYTCPFEQCQARAFYKYAGVVSHMEEKHKVLVTKLLPPKRNNQGDREREGTMLVNLWKCPDCEYETQVYKRKTYHIRLHKGDKCPYPCDIPGCQASFKSWEYLRKHSMVIHNDAPTNKLEEGWRRAAWEPKKPKKPKEPKEPEKPMESSSGLRICSAEFVYDSDDTDQEEEEAKLKLKDNFS